MGGAARGSPVWPGGGAVSKGEDAAGSPLGTKHTEESLSATALWSFRHTSGGHVGTAVGRTVFYASVAAEAGQLVSRPGAGRSPTGGQARTVVVPVTQTWPKSPEIGGGDGTHCRGGPAALFCADSSSAPAGPSPPRPRLDRALILKSLAHRAAGLGVCCCEFRQAAVHGRVDKAGGVRRILPDLSGRTRAGGQRAEERSSPQGRDGRQPFINDDSGDDIKDGCHPLRAYGVPGCVSRLAQGGSWNPRWGATPGLDLHSSSPRAWDVGPPPPPQSPCTEPTIPWAGARMGRHLGPGWRHTGSSR